MSYDLVETRYVVGDDVRAKFDGIVDRRVDHSKRFRMEQYLSKSTPVPPDTATFYHLARTLNRRGTEHMWMRSAWLTSVTQIYFIGDGDEIVEVVTFRGLRQIRKLWQHTLSQELGGGTPRDRYIDAYKHWAKTQCGGGLLNQNTGPRSRWR